MDIHRESIVSRSTIDILKFLCCVVMELFNLKDPMQLRQKMYLFRVQKGMPLADASLGYTNTVLLPTVGNPVNVQLTDIGKPDIYRRKD